MDRVVGLQRKMFLKKKKEYAFARNSWNDEWLLLAFPVNAFTIGCLSLYITVVYVKQ